jgi:uncharacterized protein
VRPVPGEPRFSIGTAALTWFLTLTVGYVLTLIILASTGHLGEQAADYPPWVTPVTVPALWVPILIGLRIVSNGFGTRKLRADYQLEFRRVDLLGIPIGIGCQLVLLELIYWPLRTGWPSRFGRGEVEARARDLFDKTHGGWRVVIILIVVVGAPLVEELLYRGLILRALDGRINDIAAVVISAAWFALAHFQGIEFPGLFAFGVVLAVCKQRTSRLGMGVLAHAAFNATTVAAMLAVTMPGLGGTP